MRDLEIRVALKDYLTAEHGSDSPLVLEEVGVLNGLSRADVVLVNGRLNGYEIKSDRDTLNRLESQVASYSECFETMTIVVGSKYAATVKKVVPRWWGIMRISTGRSGIAVKVVRTAKHNSSLKLESVLRLLWKKELALSLNPDPVAAAKIEKRSHRQLIADVIASRSSNDVLQLVRDALKARGDWRAGDTPFRRGDSLQSSSKSPRSRKNLDWLLSQRSARRQS